MSSIRLNYLRRVGLEDSPLPQGLTGPSIQCYPLRYPSLATLTAPTRLGQLKHFQPRALPMFTGQLKTTPLEALGSQSPQIPDDMSSRERKVFLEGKLVRARLIVICGDQADPTILH